MTEIPYASAARRTTVNKQTNIPRNWVAGTYTIVANNTAEALPNVCDILMVRLVTGASNSGTVYVGPSNVTSTLWASKLTPDKFSDITMDRLENIYVYGTLGDTVNYIYFVGVE